MIKRLKYLSVLFKATVSDSQKASNEIGYTPEEFAVSKSKQFTENVNDNTISSKIKTSQLSDQLSESDASFLKFN